MITLPKLPTPTLPRIVKLLLPVLIPLILIVVGVGVVLNNQDRGLNIKSTVQKLTSSKLISPPTSTASSQTTNQKEEPKYVFSIKSDGFSPKFFTIKAGNKVSWLNSDSKPHEIASDPHPTRLDYAPFNTVGKLNPKETKTLNFTTPGTFRFHDHLKPSFTGSITVR